MVERAARAILAEVWGLQEADLPSGTLDNVLAGDNGAGLDLRAVARAAVEAMREPTEGMVLAYYAVDPYDPIEPGAGYAAMIDKALE